MPALKLKTVQPVVLQLLTTQSLNCFCCAHPCAKGAVPATLTPKCCLCKHLKLAPTPWSERICELSSDRRLLWEAFSLAYEQ